MDIQSARNRLTVPSNMEKYYYPLLWARGWRVRRSYDVGVRIASNSWGDTSRFYYDSMCEQADSYMWKHNDFLLLFSAGNEGENGWLHEVSVTRSLGSVTPPALAKNVLTVGAVYSDYMDIPNGKDFITYFSSRGNPDLSRWA